MDKATEMGKTSAFGSLQLFFGTSISTVIRAVGAIVLGLFISPGDYGLYAVALIPTTTLALFQDWGIGSALIRYFAKYRATNEGGRTAESNNCWLNLCYRNRFVFDNNITFFRLISSHQRSIKNQHQHFLLPWLQ